MEGQIAMFHAGYPCRQPLTGAAAFGDDVATAEACIPGGAMLLEFGPRGPGLR